MKTPKGGKLIRDARDACKRRGHSMGPFRDQHTHRESHIATCRDCGRWAQVLPRPLPNEIEVGGPAVALGCAHPGRTRRAQRKTKRGK